MSTPSVLGTNLTVRRSANSNRAVTLRGKPAARGNRAIMGSYVIGDPSRPSSFAVQIALADLMGNDRLLSDLKANIDAGLIYVTDAANNVVSSAQLLGLLEEPVSPVWFGPVWSPGTVTDEQYLIGAAADGVVAKIPMTLKYAEATSGVANTAGSNVLTVKNITTAVEANFTFTAGVALFKRATADAALLIRKGDKFSIRWSAVGGTPGSDVQVVLRSTAGE